MGGKGHSCWKADLIREKERPLCPGGGRPCAGAGRVQLRERRGGGAGGWAERTAGQREQRWTGLLRAAFLRKREAGPPAETEDGGLRERRHLGGRESAWTREADCFPGTLEVPIINSQ